MHSQFEEFNFFAYYALVNGLLDCVIWCLGPYADDSREYGVFRHYLGAVTARICGIWLACRENSRRDLG